MSKMVKIFLAITLTTFLFIVVFWGVTGVKVYKMINEGNKEELILIEDSEPEPEPEQKPLVKAETLEWDKYMTDKDKEYVTYAVGFHDIMYKNVMKLGQALVDVDLTNTDSVNSLRDEIINVNSTAKVYFNGVPEISDGRLKEINKRYRIAMNEYDTATSRLLVYTEDLDEEGINGLQHIFSNASKNFEDAGIMLSDLVMNKQEEDKYD